MAPAHRSLVNFFRVDSLPSHEIAPNALSKLNTGVQFAWLSVGIASWAFAGGGVPVSLPFGVSSCDVSMTDAVEWLGYGVLATTAASGASYALKRGMRARTQ